MSETKIAIPIALQAIDAQRGSETSEAYTRATAIAPHQGGLAVMLESTKGNQFMPSELGLAGSYITLNPNKDYYTEALKSGIVKDRLGEFSSFFHERGITPSYSELITTIFLHELGHAKDLHGYIDRSGGDEAKAFKISREIRASQLATLPLKSATSRAKLAWNQNIAGYRDKMQAAGLTGSRWDSIIKQNTEAYAQMPCEKVADRFALGVLATMYS